MTEPRFLSPRRPGTKSHGARISKIAAALGRPHLPWQSLAADLLGEYDPITGLRTRSLSVMTVERQAGKTDLIKPLVVDRCLLWGPAQRVFYTAQTGEYAAEKWGDLVHELCAPGSPFAGKVAAKWSKGGQILTWPNGSTFRPFPPKPDALHSLQSDLVIVDESWKHTKEIGNALMSAIGPTQATRPGAQVVLLSTMGTAESTWWHDWIDKGRKGDPAVSALIDYGMSEDLAESWDADNEDHWRALLDAHPAVPALISEQFVRSQLGALGDRGEFLRAYGNARTRSDSRYIPISIWNDAGTVDEPAGRLVLAAAVAIDRSRTCILAIGAGVAEVLEDRPGTEWAAARFLELWTEHKPLAAAIHRAGPSGTLHDDVSNAGVPLTALTIGDPPKEAGAYAAACAHLIDNLRSGRLRVRRHELLDQAADAAVPSPTGDGGWVWGRRASGGPIPEIEALTLAGHLDTHRPAEPRSPVVISG